MKLKTQKRFGYMASIACIAAIVAALPLIASNVTEQQAEAQWVFRAQAMAEQNETAIAPSTQLGAKALYVQASAQPALHDALLISPQSPLDYGLLSGVRSEAAEAKCLATAIYYEARSETLAGQKAVGEVVLNRVRSKHFPDTVCGVVFEGSERTTGCQFSFTCDGSMDIVPRGKAWERSQTIAEHLQIGAHKPSTHRSTHYHTTDIHPVWADHLKSTRVIGSHAFYKFKSRREVAGILAVAP